MLSCKSPFKLHPSRHAFMYCLHLATTFSVFLFFIVFLDFRFEKDYHQHHCYYLDFHVFNSIWVRLGNHVNMAKLPSLFNLVGHFILKLALSSRQSSCQTAPSNCVYRPQTPIHTLTQLAFHLDHR